MDDEPQIASEILALKPWRLPTEIAGFESFNVVKPAGEQTASERTIGNITDSEFANRGENPGRRIPAPERILGLQGGKRWTAWARRMVAADASDNPSTFPTHTSSAIATTVSSIGVIGSTRC
jgi:hypothetical protein